MHLPDSLRFLEWLGFEFSIDFDDELVIELRKARWVDETRCRAWATHYAVAIKQALRWRAARERKRFLGGPWDGWPHDHSGYCSFHIVLPTACRLPGVKGAKSIWSAYRLMKDGRATFVGNASSKEKALCLLYPERANKKRKPRNFTLPSESFEEVRDWNPEDDRDEED